MRIVAIVGALIVGLLGLFMSVCGGGFLVTLGFDTLSYLFDAHRKSDALGELPLLFISAVSLAIGVVVCRFAFRVLRKHLDGN